MRYLRGEEVLIIHSEVIDASGGFHGIRDTHLFLSILEKPKTKFSGKEMYPDVFHKSAAYCEGFAKYHVFIDGNKRIVIAAAARFLYLNNYDFTATNKEVERFAVTIIIEKKSIEAIAMWLKKHSKKRK